MFVFVKSDGLKHVLREFSERPLPAGKPRDLSLPTERGRVVGLSGVRRCDKTFLFFDTIRRLVASGVDRRRIVYLSFEDDRFRSTATFLGVSKLARDFRSLGLSFGKNTLFDYVALLEDAGLVHLLPVHDPSVLKQTHNPKKLHVVDPGLVAAFKAGAERDTGHKLETAVFLECRRRSREWHYHAGASEVDLCDAEGRLFVNVCWDLADPGTEERERAAMEAGRKLLPGAEGLLLYHEYAPEAVARFPEARPAWQWMLERPAG